jgi:uroporphyrinogen-III decarboxylase
MKAMSEVGGCGRARMKAALSRLRPDVVPFAPCYLGLYLERRFQENLVAGYRARLAGNARVQFDLAGDNEIRLEARLRAQSVFREPHDWLWLMAGHSRAWAEQTELIAQDGKAVWHDLKSGRLTELAPAAPGSTTDNWSASVQFDSRRDVDALCPLPKAEAWFAGGAYEMMRLMIRRLGGETFMCGALGTPFWGCYSILGFEGLLCAIVEKPALLEYMLERRTAWCLGYAKVLAAVGAHGVWIEECFTGADILSPAQFRRFVMPYTGKLIEALKKLGLIGVYYVCGDVMPQLDAIMEMSPDALAVEESKKGFEINIAEVKRHVGNSMALLGNFDAIYLLEHGSPQAMEREVRRQLDACARDGGFVMSMGSPMTLTTPAERLDLLAVLTRKSSMAS